MPKSKSRGKRHTSSFVKQERRYRRNLEEVIPLVYGAFALALHRRYGFGFIRISSVIADTQKLFNESRDGDMADFMRMCYEETGIDIMSSTTAKEYGVEEGVVV